MIAGRMSGLQTKPLLCQLLIKALRVTDAGTGTDFGVFGECMALCVDGPLGIECQYRINVKACWPLPLGYPPLNRGYSISRFAQRPGWQHLAVTEASNTIDHDQFKFAPHPVMLQTIVTDHCIQRVLFHQVSHRPVAVGVYHHGAAQLLCQGFGFITTLAGIGVSGYEKRIMMAVSAITARYNTTTHPPLLKTGHQSLNGWRLTGAANRQVTHDQNGHSVMALMALTKPAPGNQPGQPA